MVASCFRSLLLDCSNDFNAQDILMTLMQSKLIHNSAICRERFSGAFYNQLKTAERLSGPQAAAVEFVNLWTGLDDDSIIFVIQAADERKNYQFAAKLASGLQKIIDSSNLAMDESVRRNMANILAEYRTRKIAQAVLSEEFNYENLLSYMCSFSSAERCVFSSHTLADLRRILQQSRREFHIKLRETILEQANRESLRVFYESSCDGRDETFRRYIEKQLSNFMNDGTFSETDKNWLRSVLQRSIPLRNNRSSQAECTSGTLELGNTETPSHVGGNESLHDVLNGNAIKSLSSIMGSLVSFGSEPFLPSPSANGQPAMHSPEADVVDDEEEESSSMSGNDPQEAC